MMFVLIKLFVTTSIILTVNSQSLPSKSETEEQLPIQNHNSQLNSQKAYVDLERQIEGTQVMDCLDPTLIHNLRNNIIEVPSRFEKIRNCRKSNGLLISLVGNKSFKYGYNLKNKVDSRLVAMLQAKTSCPPEATVESTIPRIFCPTRKPNGPWISLADFLLCDDVKNCPNGEDENEIFCRYHKSMKSELQSKFFQIIPLSQQDKH